jgi:hypothetical protein
MLKKILLLAAGAVFSLNASAGYVAYNLNGGVSGTVIQNDVTKLIVSYKLDLYLPNAEAPYPTRLGFSDHQGEGSDRISSISTYFADNGPTNFTLTSNFGGDQFTSFNLDFANGDNGGFSYTGQFSSSVYAYLGFKNFSGALHGGATLGTVSPGVAQYLDENGGANGSPVTYIGPTQVPEPGSLALLGLGVLGMASLRRKQRG